MTFQTDTIEAAKHALVSAPPTVVGTMTFAGYGLQDWVMVATLLWLAVQITWFVASKIMRRRTTITTKTTTVVDQPAPEAAPKTEA